MMLIDKAQLGKAIRQIRELREYSQAALAEKASLQPNTVALVERGQRGLSLEALDSLAEALEIPAGCLMMLGMSRIKGLSDSAALVDSMKELILSTIVAQSKLRSKERTASSKPAKNKPARTRAASTKARKLAKSR